MISKARLLPLWFDDVLMLNALAAGMMVFSWLTRKMNIKNMLFSFMAMAGAILLVLAACEVALRLFGDEVRYGRRLHKQPDRFQQDDVYRLIHKPLPHRELQTSLHKRMVSLNEYFGMREWKHIPSPDKAAGEKRVMWLGDSMTEGTTVPRTNRFTWLLESKTRHPQYVVAVGGASTDFSSLMADRFTAMIQPDLVLLGFFPMNDCFDFGRQYAECGFSPIYTPGSNGLVSHCTHEPDSVFADIYTRPPFFVFQLAAQHLFTGNLILDSRENLYRKIAEHFFYAPNPWEVDMESEPPALGAASDGICSSIMNINRQATSNRAKFAIVLIPYKPFAPEQSRKIANPKNRPDACADTVRACARENHIRLLDLKPYFDEVAGEKGPDHAFLPDSHLSPAGHAMVADKLLPLQHELLDDE